MTSMPVPESLPHYLRPGLRLVFVGYNPAIFSAQAGHYYARPGNVFWRQLNASGLVHRDVGANDDAILMEEAGIGFVDLCCRPTVRAGELTRAEIVDGAQRLHGELLQSQPRIVVFSGRGIYQHFGRHALQIPSRILADRPYGEQPERIGASVPWVIPSSSGLASRWHRERLDLLRQLAALLPITGSAAMGPGGG
ncbi:MAG: mismatch-specific DNA-glycosylase [Dehalococcoidia bacterium]|nr:mismatch-specific DNA-glycosylase [Chloroflexi bacterium CFX7]MCK6563922.1 mismatch-specific DNA-glycosylase [Dehalococcoidia bacterium]NUQ55640.1 mismatch-specific DNA-glycosylase [Dehalococcoidia bacterium]RIL02629.1 MAG: mismatch-specific DNA-glycosylase [bacterium]